MVTWNPFNWVKVAKNAEPVAGKLFDRINEQDADTVRLQLMREQADYIVDLLSLFPNGDHAAYRALRAEYIGSLSLAPDQNRERIGAINQACENVQDEREQLQLFFSVIKGCGDVSFMDEIPGIVDRMRESE